MMVKKGQVLGINYDNRIIQYSKGDQDIEVLQSQINYYNDNDSDDYSDEE